MYTLRNAYVHITYERAGVIIHIRNTHTVRRQVTVAPARRTDSRRVLLDNPPVDGQTNGRTYTGYCPVPGRSRACPIGFVSTRFLSKDISYTISTTCHIAFSFFPVFSLSFTVSLFQPIIWKSSNRILSVSQIRNGKYPSFYVTDM